MRRRPLRFVRLPLTPPTSSATPCGCYGYQDSAPSCFEVEERYPSNSEPFTSLCRLQKCLFWLVNLTKLPLSCSPESPAAVTSLSSSEASTSTAASEHSELVDFIKSAFGKLEGEYATSDLYELNARI